MTSSARRPKGAAGGNFVRQIRVYKVVNKMIGTGAVLALVEGCFEDEAVSAAAGSAARDEQPVVLLRVLAPVQRAIRRSTLSGELIEPWERMETIERTALARMRPLRDKLAPKHPVQLIVRFGNTADEVSDVAKELEAVRLVAVGGRRGVRLARELSPRLEIPILLASPDRRQPAPWRPFATDPKVGALSQVPVFAGLPRSMFPRLASHFDRVSVGAGEKLLVQGRSNAGLWVILDGQVSISVDGRLARVVGPGGVVGATSMLDGRGATATATALTPVEALVAGPADFRAIEGDPQVELRLKAASREVLRAEVEVLAAAS